MHIYLGACAIILAICHVGVAVNDHGATIADLQRAATDIVKNSDRQKRNANAYHDVFNTLLQQSQLRAGRMKRRVERSAPPPGIAARIKEALAAEPELTSPLEARALPARKKRSPGARARGPPMPLSLQERYKRDLNPVRSRRARENFKGAK